ncbi:MAG: hypothetical protein AMS19_06050 [Gemmatimonas sp. SG8_23]|nr:MAG: hypothetical protein AMS19_06050 [Gemmatimonas sp. SG8_23]
MPQANEPIRVAVVGGGCAALTTAYELTRPEHEGRYDVTVYQMGWRLGGKGASGRGPADRIEEHGLHLWLGFYENAFRLMRECYAELEPDEARRLARWDEAFSPAPDVAVVDRGDDGEWDFWLAHFPAGRGLPGDPTQPLGPMTVVGYMSRCAALVRELIRSAYAVEAKGDAAPSDSPRDLSPTVEAVSAAVDRLLRYGQLATFAALFEASDLLGQVLGYSVPPAVRSHPSSPLRLIDAIATQARERLQQVVDRDDDLRRIWVVVDLILAILRGATVHGLAFDPRGFDAINEYDWREWLRMHGASEQSVNSGFMNGIYDLVFAFEGGDVSRPRLAAGVALRGAVRMFFTYRGAFFWRMNAGMGDIVFTPLYEVLKQRGVRFEFFHRLVDMEVSPRRARETPHVRALHFDVQAKVKGGKEYQPLVDVHDVPCWPSAPDFGQLVRGRQLEKEGRAFEGHWEQRKAGSRTLEVGVDYDFVVLGVSVGAVPYVAGELIDREPRWREMVEHVKTVPTQAFQLWLRRDMSHLGWSHPPVNLSGFVQPFDTWADMEHLLPEESWNGSARAIAYFCSVLPDPTANGGEVTKTLYDRQRRAVRDNAVRFLNEEVGTLWPKAVRPRGGFRWDLLADPAGDEEGGRKRSGKASFETQFWTANVNPSDRYVLSLPGSIRYRVSPLDMHFDNLTVAGDWTATGLDSGCIESAVMSGLLAAHALSGSPALEQIVGYDHP